MKRIKRLITALLCLSLLLTAVPMTANAAKFDAKKAKKNIKATYKVTDEGILATFKNKNSVAVNLKVTMKFYDGVGTVIEKETFENECLGKKKTMAYFFRAPVTNEGNQVKYSRYTTSISVSKSKRKDSTKNINLITDMQPIMCHVIAQNLGKKNLSSINATFVFYDHDGTIICAMNHFITCKEQNTSVSFDIDYTAYRSPAKMKVYLNWAY